MHPLTAVLADTVLNEIANDARHDAGLRAGEPRRPARRRTLRSRRA
jgi:hypothetical protein